MKTIIYIVLLTLYTTTFSQTINKSYNSATEFSSNNKQSIKVTGNRLKINTKIIYNAIPNGYHITYTYTSISSSIEALEEETTIKKDAIIKSIKKLNIKPNDVIVDVIGLDPIFSLNSDSFNVNIPTGFKSTHNITFNIEGIETVDQLSKICFKNNIYDIIDIVPYINSSKMIEDSLSKKAIEVLNQKKKLAKEIGYSINDGKASFEKTRNTIFPSERYLKSFIQNTSLYRHHISQNSTINYNRRVEIDAYYNLDLRDADFIFNSKEVKPVIQFIYEINYGFIKRDREEEARLKELRVEERKTKKNIFILDKNGKMREVTF